MLSEIEINPNNDFETRSINNILYDFISALDEAIATHKVLEKIKGEDLKPNKLLFCHIINNFDSFINSLLQTIILSNHEKLKDYFQECTNMEQSPPLIDVINMHEYGIYEWMKEGIKKNLDLDLKRKRHHQKLELLLKTINIDYKNIYVQLTGDTNRPSGYLRKKPTLKNKKNLNHKTISKKLIGYADILYEKRNSVTHNGNKYSDIAIIRLNQYWNLKIDRNYVLIRKQTISAVVRFYTSIILKIIDNQIINKAIKSDYDELKSYLENLKRMKNITIKNHEDARFSDGRINTRAKLFTSYKSKYITMDEYLKHFDISLSTTSRDFQKFIEQGLIKLVKKGEYEIINQK